MPPEVSRTLDGVTVEDRRGDTPPLVAPDPPRSCEGVANPLFEPPEKSVSLDPPRRGS